PNTSVSVVLIFSWLAVLLSFHSFPTRRPSDLDSQFAVDEDARLFDGGPVWVFVTEYNEAKAARLAERNVRVITVNEKNRHVDLRSEEHTSELQSRENLVCRLLLEKKKKQQQSY